MVVTRRKPVVPPSASASRTSSTQPLPRTAKPKATQPNPPDAGSQVNGHKKPPASNKSKTKKKKKTEPSILTFLRNILLILTTIYAFLACPDSPVYTSPSSPFFSSLHPSSSPKDTTPRHLPITPIPQTILPSPHPLICRTVLGAHNKIVLPFHAHVVSPLYAQVSRATSMVAYSDTFSPYTTFASRFYHERIAPAYSTRVVPFVNNHVVPLYHKWIVPLYTKHVFPFVTTRIIPAWKHTVLPTYQRYYDRYFLRYWRIYISRPLAPYVQASLRVYDKNVAPVAARVAKITSNLLKILMKAWNRAQPYLERFLTSLLKALKLVHEKLEPRLYTFARSTSSRLGDGWVRISQLRKVYVDPHVKQMWVKVKELSGSHVTSYDQPTSETSKVQDVERDIDHASTILPSITDDHLQSESSVVEASFSPTAPSPSDSQPEPTSASSITPTEPIVEEITSPSSVPESVASVDVEHNSSVAQESQVTASLTPSTSEADPTPTDANIPPSPSPDPAEELFLDPEGFVDLDDFLAGLGIDLNEASAPIADAAPASSSSIVEVTPSPSPSAKKTNPADMDPEERAVFMQEKRLDITSRHSRWESEIEALIEEKTKEIRQKVFALRDAGVGKVLDKDGTIQVKAEEMVKEGEKLLKGIAGWVGAHKDAPYAKPGQAVSGDSEKEKARDRELYDKLVAKVEEKFRDKVGEVEDEVRGWYMDVRNREIEEVLHVEHEVLSLAERAQADIGLDYAWLDDVTYQDWQRYHDLVRRSERFSDIARSLQNGTHETSPEDPMVPTLEDLRSEVQDIVNAFEARLRSYKQSAEGLFSGAEHLDERHEDDVAAEADSNRVPKNDGPEQEPAVPVPPLGSHEAGDESQDHEPSSDAIPPVLLGRSEGEVVEALGRAAAQADGRSAKSIVVTETSDNSGANEIPPLQSQTAQLPVHVEL